jgi:flagellar assembly factor FliW
MTETGLSHAIKEAQDAIVALEAAARRLNEATANLAAAIVINKSQQGPL